MTISYILKYALWSLQTRIAEWKTHSQNLEFIQFEILLYLIIRKENHLFMKSVKKYYDVGVKIKWLEFYWKILSTLWGNLIVGLQQEDPCLPTW